MTKRGKWSAAIVVLVAAAAGGALWFVNRGPKAIEVRGEKVEKRDLVSLVVANGQVQPRVRVNLSADITGRIVQLPVKEGQWVTTGQILLRIDSAQYVAAVQRSEATLASVRAQAKQSEANFKQAQSNLARNEEIRKTNPGLVTSEAMEQLRTQVEVATANYDAAQRNIDQAIAGLEDAKNNLTKTTIRAPMTGRITRLVVQEGETAIMGTLNKDAATLMTISDMSVLETRVRVDETDVAHIEIGDSAAIQLDAFPDTNFVGRVVQISNSSVRGTAGATGQPGATSVDYEVTIQILNPPADTRPDFSATAKIVTAVRKDRISIPIAALTIREITPLVTNDSSVVLGARSGGTIAQQRDEEGVWLIGTDNKVTFRPVKTGITGERHFEVLQGLEVGDLIVAGSHQAIRQLKDSSLVRQQVLTAPTDTLKKPARI